MKIRYPAMVVVLALVAGCSSGQTGSPGRTGADVADATVRISASGQKVRPDQGVTVTVSGGTLLLRHLRGDIVDVTHTTRGLADEPYADDWKFWTRSWTQWLAGSALRQGSRG